LQLSISAALTHTKNVEVARRIIEEGLGAKGFVRSQDIFRWYAYLMRNRYTREQAWEWLTSSWDMLSARFGGGKSFDHFIVYSSASIHTKDWETKFTNFFEPKETIIALKRNIVIAKSEIRSRVAWHDRNEKPLEHYLLDR
jgi:aminopeptidase N